MADNKNTFILDDGTKEITINNQFGQEIAKVHIRTGDIGIYDRYNKFIDKFDEIIKPLATISLKSDGTASFDDDWGVIKNVESELIGNLNSIFDSKDIGNLFENRNAFSTIGGVFYIENVINMLGELVSQEMTSEVQKAQKRVSKYTKDISKKGNNA